MRNIYAIILSGGVGTRFKSNLPKQFSLLRKEPLLIHSVKQFLNWGLTKQIIVVANEEYVKQTEEVLSQHLRYNDKIVLGGKTRHTSCLNGIHSISYDEEDIILIHDAARPFFTYKEIFELVNATIIHKAASLAEKISETLLEAKENLVEKILNRDLIYSIKTPQAIHAALLKRLIETNLQTEPTDLCSWLMEIQQKTFLISSNPFNFKITYETDLLKAEQLYESFIKYQQEENF